MRDRAAVEHRGSSLVRFCVALGVLIAVAVGSPAPALAERARVAIGPFEGGRHGRVLRKQVIKAIKKKYQVISWDERDDADAVIGGRVKRARGKYAVRIEVRDVDSDEVVTDYRFRDRKPRLRDAAQRKLLREVASGLAEIRRERQREEDEEEAEDDDDMLARAPQAAPEPVARPEPAVVKRAPVRDDRASWRSISGRASAGASFISRNLGIGAGSDDVATYDSTIYAPGVHVDGELVLGRRFGVELFYDRSIGLKSGFEVGQTNLPTTQSRATLGGFYRASLLGGRLDVQPGIGVGRIAASIDDRGAEMPVTVPDVSYTYVAPAVGARVGVHERLAVVGRVGVLVGLSAGEISEAEQYGSTSVLGFDLLAAADVAIVGSFGLRVGGTYSRVGLAFDGNGQMAATAGGQDRLIGAQIAANYLF